MFFFSPSMLALGLTSADYSALDPELSYEEKCNGICENFRSDLRKYCSEKDEIFPKELESNDRIIILWRNVPDPTSGKVPINQTLSLICNSAVFYGRLFIRSIHDIVDTEGMEQLIHAIAILSKGNGTYTFLDNDFFSYQRTKEKIDPNNLRDSVAIWLETKPEANMLPILAGVLVSELDSLIQRPASEPIDNFLDVYWKWQTAQVSVEICKDELGIAHRTFYKYSQLYENTPYYCEHLKLFYFQVAEVAKRGTLPDRDDYMRDMYALEMGHISKKEICKKYGLASEIDIHRVELAFTKRRRKAIQ